MAKSKDKALICYDDTETAEQLREFLQYRFKRVDITEDHCEAIEIMKKYKYKMLCTDYRLIKELMFSLNISDIIKLLRKDRGISQDTLADDLGMYRGTIIDWENGKSFPSPDSLQKVADYFGISLELLIKRIFYK